ncbi:glycine cleavage system protein GcvH [Kitasatospora sp. NBC_01246]|uniref:glycine cleavage system protein GcvH n=1 Tax=Kitasatospora sp. NBC_01246 TaxID=2903570 RepID=UPI002E331F6A|nr:glycine cleavage system protein GcvH [Kitasatospora sp. NBC_01246]
MTNIPTDRKYSRDHEWVRSLGNGRLRIGITDHAQRQLGDIVFVELPKQGDVFESGEPFGSVESVKSVSELYTALGGTVSVVNEELNDSPELLNEDPYEEGWIIEVTPAAGSGPEGLLTAAEYQDYITSETAE